MFTLAASTWLIVAHVGLTAAQDSQQVDTFAPVYVTCPENLNVRRAYDGLSREEQTWRNQRSQNIIPALGSYLRLANISGLDVDSFTRGLNSSNVPVVGLSISGGGTQSGIGGLGIWEAYDSRSASAQNARTGGIAQILMYLTGLSGGGAVTVSTIASNNFTTLDGIRQAVNFSVDYTVGPTGNDTEYYDNIFENVGAKAEAGFAVSVADAFGQFWTNYLPQSWLYSNYSDLASSGNAFSAGEAPMPIITLAEIVPGQSPNIGGLLYPGNNATNGFNLTSYEISPYEFGSWLGGRVQAFMPTKYLGSAMNNGSVQNSSQCVEGFDKFSLIQGSTADAFTAWFIDSWYGVPIFAKRSLATRQAPLPTVTVPPDQEDNPLVQLVNETASNFGLNFGDAMWATYPNPFENYNEAMNNISELLLVDGSLTGETNPIRPLIIPARGVDFIIVYESSSDAPNSWVNGTNLINTARSASEGNIPFPQIPDVTTMIKQNLTRQPSLFGCNDSSPVPLVLYLPNSPWSGYSNFSFLTSSFTDEQFNDTVNNAFNLATYGNGTVDTEWPQCLACAVIRGAMHRIGADMPDQCTQCFRRHCWNGTTAAGEISTEDFNLIPRLNASLTFQEWNHTVWNAANSNNAGSIGSSGGDGSVSGGGGSGWHSAAASLQLNHLLCYSTAIGIAILAMA